MTLEELEALRESTTPGMWVANGGYIETAEDVIFAPSHCNGRDDVNASYICALVNEAPALLAELKQLRADYTKIADALGYANWHEGHAQVADAETIIAHVKGDLQQCRNLLGEVICYATLQPGDEPAAPSDHAAVAAILGVVRERDALLEVVDTARWSAKCLADTGDYAGIVSELNRAIAIYDSGETKP